MKGMIRSTFVLLVFFSSLLSMSYAQSLLPAFGSSRSGTSGMQFLKTMPDARSVGMSGAVHAIVNDATAMFWNPAGMNRMDTVRAQIYTTHGNQFAGIQSNYIGAIYRPSDLRCWGFQLYNYRSPDMKETTEFMPDGTGRIHNLNNVLVGLSYSQVLTQNFSFGLTAKYAYEGLATVFTNNVLFDFGFQYIVGWKDIRFSAGFSNFGLNVQPGGEITILNLFEETTVNSFQDISVPAIFRLGLAKEFKIDNEHNINSSFQVNHPTDNRETLGLGVEYSFRKMFFARTGYEFGASVTGTPSFGLGYKLQRNFGGIRFDYGFANRKSLGNLHFVTLGINIK